MKSIVFTSLAAATMLLAACSDGDHASTVAVETKPFKLAFKAVVDNEEIDCGSVIPGLGPNNDTSISVSDVRFFVSGLTFYDQQGEIIESSLDTNEFQYNSDVGSVGLVDLTSNNQGSCNSEGIEFGEGTARVNHYITGHTHSEQAISSVSFDVGVPQALMKSVIATNTAEDAPSPLGELYWSWASGYRHFVVNFAVIDKAQERGEGFLHIGSRGCGDSGLLALENKQQCDRLNTPAVHVTDFNPAKQTIIVDIKAALKDITFVREIREPKAPYTLIGANPGVACHSTPVQRQPDCGPIFANLGLDMASGMSKAVNNIVFRAQ